MRLLQSKSHCFSFFTISFLSLTSLPFPGHTPGPRHEANRLKHPPKRNLNHQPLDLVFQAPNLSHQLAPLVGGDAGSDDGSADAACSPQRRLAGHIDVRHVLVFAQERQVQQDGQGRRVGRQDDDFRRSAVKGLGRCEREKPGAHVRKYILWWRKGMRGCGQHHTFVGALSQLVVMRGFCCLCQHRKSPILSALVCD